MCIECIDFAEKKPINAVVSCEKSFHKWSVFYSGTHSYKEHGFRLLMIWLHGVRKDENVMRLLFEALSTIDRRSLAGIFTIIYSLIQKTRSSLPVLSNGCLLGLFQTLKGFDQIFPFQNKSDARRIWGVKNSVWIHCVPLFEFHLCSKFGWTTITIWRYN